MYSIQSNSARFIYTLNYLPNENNIIQSKLKTGLYFSKQSRSDEKFRYTETDLHSIVRTVLFMHVFQIAPIENAAEITNSGQVSYNITDAELILPKNILTIDIIVALLDDLFGENFSAVIKRVINKCFLEYCTVWRYYPYNDAILKLPSASDYINLRKFVNTTDCEFGKCEQFIMANSTDHKIPLQQMHKIL